MFDKSTILAKCRDFFTSREEVRIVYLLGSFLKVEEPGDLDLTLCLASRSAEPIHYSLRIAREPEDFLMPIEMQLDAKVLNNAPPIFPVRGREGRRGHLHPG